LICPISDVDVVVVFGLNDESNNNKVMLQTRKRNMLNWKLDLVHYQQRTKVMNNILIVFEVLALAEIENLTGFSVLLDSIHLYCFL
jgi:hypothetical protein